MVIQKPTVLNVTKKKAISNTETMGLEKNLSILTNSIKQNLQTPLHSENNCVGRAEMKFFCQLKFYCLKYQQQLHLLFLTTKDLKNFK